MKNKQMKFVIGALIVLSSIGYLMYTGVQETSVFFLTVSEAKAREQLNEDIRIEGKVSTGTVKKASDGLSARFSIEDEKNHVAIDYKGTVPDMFAEGIDVIVQGRFDYSTNVFHAHTLLTSCPSKYEASEQKKG